MRTKVKGKIMKLKCNTLYSAEYLSQYLPTLSRYFDNIGNCMYALDITRLTNTALIFTRVSGPNPATNNTPAVVELEDRWGFPIEDAI